MARGYVLEVDWDADGDYGDANEDVSADLLNVEFLRGCKFASQLTGRSEAGSLKALLRNPDGLYSPSNASSALAGKLLPGRKLRFRVTGDDAKTRWTGFIEKLTPKHISSDGLVVELQAAGPMSLLDAKVNPPASTGALTGTHVAAVLDEAGWHLVDCFVGNRSPVRHRQYCRPGRCAGFVRRGYPMYLAEVAVVSLSLCFDTVLDASGVGRSRRAVDRAVCTISVARRSRRGS